MTGKVKGGGGRKRKNRGDVNHRNGNVVSQIILRYQ